MTVRRLRPAEQHPESLWSWRPGPEVLKWCCSVNSRTYSKTLSTSMVPVNNSKPYFSSSVFICTTILVHAWPLFLNLRYSRRSRNSVKNSALEAWSAQFSDRFPGFADSRTNFQSCFWFWDSGLSRNLMLFCGPEMRGIRSIRVHQISIVKLISIEGNLNHVTQRAPIAKLRGDLWTLKISGRLYV